MATPANLNNPSFSGADIKDPEVELAFEEGHDADIPTNISTPKTKEQKDLEAGPSRGNSLEENEVWWDDPEEQDPLNPLNWPMWRKWGTIAILSVLTLITPLASSMFAPGVPQVMKDFHSNSDSMATFVVSVYLLGFALGPLLIAPLSEQYGRYPIYTISNIFFVVFCIACAVSTNLGMLIAFRFLHGVVGVTPLTIGGGTIADMMPVEKRGVAMSVWAMGPLLGPIFGPVAGGYLVEAKGWRWVFWVLTMMSGTCSIVSLTLLSETYAPVILERKANRLRKETGNSNLRSRLASDKSRREIFNLAVARPTKMLLFSPMCSALCVYVSIAYGILYLLFTTFTYVFEGQYHFSPGSVGLTYIALGVGMIAALGIMGTLSDRIVKNKQARGETPTPEDRIPFYMTVPAALCLPVGLFIYGWGVQYKVHWVVPLLGTTILGFGLLISFIAVQTYLIDAFVRYAASAVAANTVLRSLFGGLLPLCGLQMYHVLGLGWGNSLLAFIALAIAPIPLLFSKYGERIRTNPKYQIEL